jgi:hypothetical protein
LILIIAYFTSAVLQSTLPLFLGKEISLLECINYLEFVVAEHQLSFTPGEKTKLILGQVLNKFSVAQAYSFIWRSAKDAAEFYMRAQVN